MLFYTETNFHNFNFFIYADNEYLYKISFQPAKEYSEALQQDNELLRRAKTQLQLYFDGKLTEFDLPFILHGTDFQKKVWQQLIQIPYGCCKSYKDIAVLCDKPNASRAVGNACNSNPLPLIVPCHRVIGSSGKLTGYAGGLDLKRLLLALEQQKSSLIK